MAPWSSSGMKPVGSVLNNHAPAAQKPASASSAMAERRIIIADAGQVTVGGPVESAVEIFEEGGQWVARDSGAV